MKNLQEKLNKYDNQLIYISGYHNCYSKVKCYCKRCNNYFERKWCNITRHTTEYSCPICQKEFGQEKSITNRNNVYIIPLEEREKAFIKKLAITKPTFTYISGYKDAKSNVLVKCNKCGYEMYRGVDRLTRKNKNIICRNCEKLKMQKENNKKKLIAQQKKRVQEIKQERQKELCNIYKELKRKTQYINKCKMCNEELISHYSNRKICDKCGRKHKLRCHSNKSLKELYKRDKGICYICGGKCDYEDYIYHGSTFIAGNYYPSVDHVIPLNKGGEDTWENIKLAHRICNSLKRDD